MRSFIAYFLRYPVLGNSLLILTLIFGYMGMRSLKSTMFPEAESKIINVQVTLPGASPEEIEEGIILKIEDNLKGLTGVERISSVSNENTGTVTVEVLKEYETQMVLMDVKNAVDKIPSFPPAMEPPVVFIQERLNFALGFALKGEVSLKALKEKAQEVESELRSVEGISKIELSGFPAEEIEIRLREDDLRAYNLTFAEVASAVAKANIDVTGGTIKTTNEELLVRGRGKNYRADGLKEIVIKSDPNGTVIKLGQVAEVVDQWSDNPNRNWYNGERAVVISVSNTIDEDIIFITDYLYDYIETFNDKNEQIEAVITRDGSTSLRQRIALLTENGLLGALLVLIFLALFLDGRLAFWVALGIPVSFAGMFILASFYGLTINVISLFGMILVVGILVDDGIVISENIFQKYEEGMQPLPAAINGTLEVLPAVFSAILTTVVAFGSFFFLDGRLGEFAPNMAFVVMATLAFSLIEGALILPAHVSHSKALRRDKRRGVVNQKMSDALFWFRDKIYAPFYDFCLTHKFFTVAFSLALLILTIGSIGGGVIKTTFFPSIERNNMDVVLKMPAGTRDHITKDWLNHIEDAVWRVNEQIKQERGDGISEIENTQVKLGPTTYDGNVGINLIDAENRSKTSFEISNMVREQAGVVQGAESVTYGVASAFGKPVSIALKGYDLRSLEEAKTWLVDSLNSLTTLKDVTVSDQPGLREVNLELRPEAKVLGLQLQDILGQVRRGFFGAEAQRLQRGEDDVKVWVRYREEDRSSIEKMMDMRIGVPNGQQIPLRELATYEIERGVTAINHLDGMREIRVDADVASPDLSVSDITVEIEDQLLPSILNQFSGVQFSLEGQSRQNQKVASSMQQVMPIVLIIMFAVIVFTFRSFSQSVAVYSIIPFGVIGVGWGHFVHGLPISMLSAFGIIALIGVMVNDSLVFVTMVNNNIKRGLSYYDAIYEAGKSRFRPIILTSITTIAGLAPLILEKSFQAQFLVPMAISVGYGMLIATFTTLILLPVVLLVFNSTKRGLYTLWTGKKVERNRVEAAYREMKSIQEIGEIE